ncbi:MAG: hypothetical protein A2V90_09390 [Gammaproteobacteria bacterium RBG_16_57_12]|nr:MAG: hypothetical protein A2V90_09390 [Gammaproteobacteria bacterium RBG_16_57_12]
MSGLCLGVPAHSTISSSLPIHGNNLPHVSSDTELNPAASLPTETDARDISSHAKATVPDKKNRIGIFIFGMAINIALAILLGYWVVRQRKLRSLTPPDQETEKSE